MSQLIGPRSWLRAVCAVVGMLVGCESSSGTGLTVVQPEGCSADDPAVVYRLTELHVPTHADVDAGALVGHDLDGVGEVCGVPDYAGGVDNSLIDLARALPLLAPDDPFVLQDAIDAELLCTAADAECEPRWLGVRVQECRRGVKVDLFRVADDQCTALGTADRAGLSGDGELRAEFVDLALDEAFDPASDLRAVFRWDSARLTATVTDDGLEDAVLGGVLPSDAFDFAIYSLFPGIPEAAFPAPLEGLFDIAREPGGVCDGLSMGLTLRATVDASGQSCE